MEFTSDDFLWMQALEVQGSIEKTIEGAIDFDFFAPPGKQIYQYNLVHQILFLYDYWL